MSFDILPQIEGGSSNTSSPTFILCLRVRAGYLLDIEIQIGHKISRTAMADATDYVGSYKFAHHWTEEWFL